MPIRFCQLCPVPRWGVINRACSEHEQEQLFWTRLIPLRLTSMLCMQSQHSQHSQHSQQSQQSQQATTRPPNYNHTGWLRVMEVDLEPLCRGHPISTPARCDQAAECTHHPAVNQHGDVLGIACRHENPADSVAPGAGPQLSAVCRRLQRRRQRQQRQQHPQQYPQPTQPSRHKHPDVAATARLAAPNGTRALV
jgi:hypothetical protein